MECLDRDLTEEQILRRIDRYLNGELPFDEDKQFTDHILDCEYCQETLLLYKMMIRVGKEYGDEIFLEVSKSPKEDQQIPTLWLMLNNAVKEEISLRPGIPWSCDLSEQGVYCLIDKQNKVLWQEEISTDLIPGGHVRGRHSPIPRKEIKTMKSGNKEDRKFAITIERKKQKLILLLTAE